MERRFEACSPDEGVVGEHRLLSQLLGGVNGGDSARHALCAESDTDARTGGRVLRQLGANAPAQMATNPTLVGAVPLDAELKSTAAHNAE